MSQTDEGREKSYYFSNIKFTKDATGVWASDPPQWWINNSTGINFNFYGYAPADIQGASYIADEETWQPKLRYVVPQDITQQTDILYNTPVLEYIASSNRTVPLTMAHALAVVDFRTGTGMSVGTINKVTINNVIGSGTLNLTDGSWTLDEASSTAFTVEVNKQSADGIDITDDANGTHFILLPGCNTEASQVAVDFTKPGATGPTTYYGALTDMWEAGKIYRYTITIDPDFNITLDDPNPQDAHYVICKATVNVANMQSGQKWELTATASDGADVTLLSELNTFQKQGFWTDRILYQEDSKTTADDSGSARGEKSLSGPASGDVYIFLPENISGKDRIIKLEMKVAGAENILATAEIKQVTAVWNSAGFAWEQFEDDNPAATWGFLWDRVVKYRGKGGWWALLYVFDMFFIDQFISQYNASEFVTRADWSVNTTIDYSKLSNLDGLNLTNDDGLFNTKELYKFGGSATTGSIERALNSLNAIEISSDIGENNMTSAALGFILKKNKYNLLKIEKKNGNDTQVTESALIDYDNISWYLPAVEQLNTPPAEGDPWIGEYWSSTPDGNKNAFTSANSVGRMTTHKIRACRNRN